MTGESMLYLPLLGLKLESNSLLLRYDKPENWIKMVRRWIHQYCRKIFFENIPNTQNLPQPKQQPFIHIWLISILATKTANPGVKT